MDRWPDNQDGLWVQREVMISHHFCLPFPTSVAPRLPSYFNLILCPTRPVPHLPANSALAMRFVSSRFGKNVYVNSNSTWIDTCTITVGARTLIGPNCSFYSGTHPLDPRIRNGTRGPELGKPIVIEEDCWLGGGVTVLAGITIGKGSTVGAGSIVTRDVPPFSCVVGNPARLLKKIDISTEPSWS